MGGNCMEHTLSDAEVARLATLSDDALKGELGRAILKAKQGGLQARPPSLKKLIEEANTWLAAENAKLRDLICRNAEIRALATSEQSTTEKLVRTVADVISGVLILVPVGTVAEILVRDGIPKYCKVIWAENP